MKVKELFKKIIGNKKILIPILIVIVIILVILFVMPNKEGEIEISVKNSLNRLVEKSDLETATFTYNVIAKQCKDKEKCNLDSNNIDDFKYVVSCQGTLTAGIDFKKVKIEVDEKEKKLVVMMPEATIKGDPNVESTKFINGDELPASELPNAIKLCANTIKEKSNKDETLLPAAKEQAKVVLESFYKQWIQAFDKEYKVEVK